MRYKCKDCGYIKKNWKIKGKEINKIKEVKMTRQKLKKKDKEKLKQEKRKIIEKIIKRNNKRIYEDYLDIKRLIEINQELSGNKNIYDIAQELNMSPKWINYIRKLDKLQNEEWLEKIDIRIILYILNFSRETCENQEELLKEANKMNWGLDKVKYEIYKRYSKSNPEVIKKKPHILYQRLIRDLDKVIKSFSLLEYVEFSEKQIEEIKRRKQELEEKLEELHNKKEDKGKEEEEEEDEEIVEMLDK